jgi:hypothetical protein
MFTASTQTEFDTVRDAEVQDTTSYTFLKPPVNDTVLKDPTLGYQPMEYLKGSRLVDGVEILRNGDRVSFIRPGIFGHCEYNTPALFMQNAQDETCVVVHSTFKQTTCENKVSFKSIANMKLKINPEDTVYMDAKIGEVTKFSQNTYRVTADEATVKAQTTFQDAVFTPDDGTGTCGCDNFVLEAHYKVYFDQSEDTANSFFVKDFVVDIVYGNLQETCDT